MKNMKSLKNPHTSGKKIYLKTSELQIASVDCCIYIPLFKKSAD